ncbi:MAG TPA: hypothetical protein VLA02_03025 [Reyranella sp.]|nr:hypothetical protein [Reyranella sp.]
MNDFQLLTISPRDVSPHARIEPFVDQPHRIVLLPQRLDNGAWKTVGKPKRDELNDFG